MAVIFAKTRKGQDEISAKSGGLTPRQRRVLIMIDGRRTIDDLRDLLPSDDLQHTLGLLEEGAYIAVSVATDPTGHVLPADEPMPSITAFRPLPDPPNARELDMAKNFIMNSLRTFTGPYTHLSLIEAAFAAASHAELREQFAPWYHAIVQTRDGRRRAEELRSQLLHVI